ncbi:DEAD/DEAH box helicase [Zavarzinella formosa]|uniref:DEAD/DEAH box helicase n=1 Tax=Zavarzinella formosa TaxID=360055 RepID=UPI0003095AEE|nr:DEAD/DEAH box helicase [Zavarzinella formosa]
MLREEQIDIRRQRARTAKLVIENIGSKQVFSDYKVTNPQTNGQYTVTIRGFDTGDNTCTCPDFKSNTLGTCKHIEGVLEQLSQDSPQTVKKRKAAITRPEITLDYTAHQLRLRLQLPPRHSDKLAQLAARFFDKAGFAQPSLNYVALVDAVESVPEQVTVMSDALDFIGRENERMLLATREKALLAELESGDEQSPLRSLLKIPLYDYQLRGAIFMACRGRSILGDDMGLGKTIQTMAAIEILARERGVSRVLVIAPASVKYQWETEIRKFTGRAVQVVEGLKDVREEQYSEECFYKLVNYEQVVRDLDLLNKWEPHVVVLDEAQRIKNWEAKTSRAVKKLVSPYAMVLTGTPLENKLEELYSIVQFVDDRRLGPAFEFLHEHRVLDEKGNLVGYQNLDRIRERLAPILLRRTRGEVLTQLPARTDSTLFVELKPEQKAPYDEQVVALARLLQKGLLTDVDRKRILACISNMRLICDSTFLFDKETNVSPKLEEFRAVVEELMSSGEHKAVIFSQWETMLNKAAEVLNDLGVGFTLLHGGMSGKERRAVMARFKEKDCRMFLSTDAGGVGLNLQEADTVMSLELPWNPAVLEQRIARVHRMGQQRPVRVINFVTRNSIEERVMASLEAKRSLFGSVFDGDSDAVDFAAIGSTTFLDGVREVVGLEKPAPAEPKTAAKPPVAKITERETTPDLVEAGLCFLEALVAESPRWNLTSEQKARFRSALGLLTGGDDE